MRARTVGLTLVTLLLLALFALYPPLPLVDAGEYERTTVTLFDENGTELADVDVRIADTREQRRIGLSRTDSLANGTGMLFVHDSVGGYSYVMRNMTFGLDIIFVDADGTVTEIHDAPEPDGEYDQSYAGRGKYVLEVPRGWSASVGLSVGDRVEVIDDVA